MRARLEQLGGTLEIYSNPTMQDCGTMISAVFAHGLAIRVRKRRKPEKAVSTGVTTR
jgi:hypothetical protein